MPTTLVVDDFAMDRRLAGGLLSKLEGWEVIFADDGDTALEQLERHLPDLVVTDLQMPRMNGLELVQAVKRDFPLIPIILMTATGSEEIAVQALQQGAASYVPKRRLAQDLAETAERVLASSGEERGLARLLNRLVFREATYSLENDLSLIGALVRHIRAEVLAMRLIAPSEVVQLSVALDEALLNAYYHGNLEVSSRLRELDHQMFFDEARKRSHEPPYCNRRITLTARLGRDEMRFTICDEGPGFDRSEVPDPTLPENLERPCGRGILLMRTFMDHVEFNDRGNAVTLIKRPTDDLSITSDEEDSVGDVVL
jgi:CheY-like chemotaxis protein